MRPFEFRFWLADDPRSLDVWSHALYEAGADDTMCGFQAGRPYARFSRESASLEDAIRSAREQIQTAGLRVLRCELEEEEMAAWK